MSKVQFKEQDGLTFYRKPYTDTWVISGIDICKELRYKNPYEQAYKIYKRYEENFKDTSFLIPVLKYKKEDKNTPQSRGCFLDKNHKEIRCYTRPGLWFFTSKCNIPKANKLIENLFKKFDKLIDDLNKTKNQEWKAIREKGKESRKAATDSYKYFIEYAKDNGSTNADKYYMIYTQLIHKAVSGLKKVPSNFREIATKQELEIISIIEDQIKDWLEQCIELHKDRHDIYQIIKDEVQKRVSLMRQVISREKLFIA